MQTSNLDNLQNCAEVARRLKCSKQWVYQHVRDRLEDGTVMLRSHKDKKKYIKYRILTVGGGKILLEQIGEEIKI